MTTSEYPKPISAEDAALYEFQCEWCNATTDLQFNYKGSLIVECVEPVACNERDCDLHAKDDD